ncbi:MAG TPA: glycosyltransferase family 9 protein [Dissulfurispiraceae bacterium]|nr:glycosyltransferase family 9 protein [Dissulfurispiraceae bacterium]
MEILVSVEKKNITSLLMNAFNRTWVMTVNLALKVFTLLLFKKSVMERGREFKNIVVYTAGVLGDNVVRLAAVANLKRRYPGATVTVMVSTDADSKIPSQLFSSLPYVDDHAIANGQVLNRHTCDLFVNFSGSVSVGSIRLVLREMRYAYRMGAECAIGFYISTYGLRKSLDPVQHHFLGNEPRRCYRVLREIGLIPAENISVFPENREAKDSVLSKLNARGDEVFAVMSPGSGKQCKFWPPERFGQVAILLQSHYNARVVLTGHADEREIAEKIHSSSKCGVTNLVGETSIQELVELLRMSRICITNDTGVLHVAAVLGIPTVAIFNMHLPPTWWFPDNENIIQLFSVTECSFCNKFICDSKKCLDNITVDHVFRAASELISQPESDGR